MRPKSMDWPTVEDYFWAHIAAARNNCWFWIGPFQRNGKVGADHGLFSYANERHYAHRLSWRINRGEIPDGMSVLHHCDVPRCVNPDHLYIGSQRDNVMDRISRGRSAPMPYMGKLTEEQVREVRSRLGHRNESKIARDMGISRSTVNNIARGRVYGWVS